VDQSKLIQQIFEMRSKVSIPTDLFPDQYDTNPYISNQDFFSHENPTNRLNEIPNKKQKIES